jgi:hypothetical protein
MPVNSAEVIVTNVMIVTGIVFFISGIISFIGVLMKVTYPLETKDFVMTTIESELVRAWVRNWVTLISFPICGLSGYIYFMCLFALHG